jgi:hypothetical protein
MDIDFDELFEDMNVFLDCDDELHGDQESLVDFLDDNDGDMSLTL